MGNPVRVQIPLPAHHQFETAGSDPVVAATQVRPLEAHDVRAQAQTLEGHSPKERGRIPSLSQHYLPRFLHSAETETRKIDA